MACDSFSEAALLDAGEGEVITPMKNSATHKTITNAVLMFFFSKKDCMKGSGNIKNAARSINRLEK